MRIRPETDQDYVAVREVIIAAFESPAEADLVEQLREHARPLISLVASIDDSIVGHILFSPVTLEGHPEFNAMGLAPMAVVPSFQRQGIGSNLVMRGLEAVRQLNAHAVVVLGHPEYYPRFGFKPASHHGIRSTYDVPDGAFMILELQSGAIKDSDGTIHYHPVFGNL